MPWKRTEWPEYADHCRRICERYGVDYYGFDVLRDEIEETIEDDPVAASVPVDQHIPEIRKIIYEPNFHWNLPSLVVVFDIREDEEAFVLSSVWTEEELEERGQL